MGRKRFAQSMTFENYINNVYFTDIKKKFKCDTVATKKWQINSYMIPYFGQMPLTKISVSRIQKWLDQLKETKLDNDCKLSLSYIQALHSSLQTVLQHAVDNYGFPVNNAKKVDKVLTWAPKQATMILTLDEYKKFSNEAMFQPMYFYIFEVLFWTGMKQGELLALTPKDIDLNNKTITITNTHYRQNEKPVVTPLSNDIKKRIISIPNFLSDELKEYISTYKIEKGQRIFSLEKTAINRHAHSFAKKAEVKNVSVSTFRDSHAVMLLDEGFSLSDIAIRLGITYDAAEDRYSSYMKTSSQKHVVDTLENLRKD